MVNELCVLKAAKPADVKGVGQEQVIETIFQRERLCFGDLWADQGEIAVRTGFVVSCVNSNA